MTNIKINTRQILQHSHILAPAKPATAKGIKIRVWNFTVKLFASANFIVKLFGSAISLFV